MADQEHETVTVNKALTPLPYPQISGLKLDADIQLGSLVLNTIDVNGVVWVCTDIEGWWVHTDPSVPDIERGFGDGSYDVRGRWLARQITLSGVFLPPGPSFVQAARNTLVSATSLVYTSGWLYVNENPKKASKVRLSGRPDIETVNARGRTEFSIGLRAADPIKYEWKDAEPDGYTIVTIPCANTAASETGVRNVQNIGNTKVSAVFVVSGPITGNSTIYNSTTNELITILQPLRAATTKTASLRALTSNVATITTTAAHTFLVNDLVTVSIANATFDGVHTVTSVPTTTTFTYAKVATDVVSGAAVGTASIAVDILEIDTYDHAVAFNEYMIGTRSMIDVLVDWTQLGAGANSIEFSDASGNNASATMDVYYRSGWIG